ncbi:MAG: HDOD domain-containing protein, partial [Nitrospinota bacterium]
FDPNPNIGIGSVYWGQATRPEQLYLAGILHDIGQLVLLQKEPEIYFDVCLKSKNSSDQGLIIAEKEELGYDHAQIGGILLKEWRLPASIYVPVMNHHEPLKAQTYKEESLILHIAELIAYEVGFGKSSEPALPFLQKEAIKFLNLNLDFIYEIRSQIRDKAGEAVNKFF